MELLVEDNLSQVYCPFTSKATVCLMLPNIHTLYLDFTFAQLRE